MILQMLVAGMAAGYTMALLSTAASTYLLSSWISSGRLERWLDRGVPKALVAVQVLFAATALWILLGTGLAAFYLAGDFHTYIDGLGSPSLPFTVLMLALALAPLPLLVVVNAARWWLWSGMSLAFALAFGWILPLAGE